MADIVSPEGPAFEAEEMYQPTDAIGEGIRGATMVGGAGLFFAAVQNTVAKENIGTFGIISRSGGTIALFAGMGGAYGFASCAAANLRATNDHWNQFYGGFAAGAVAGFRKRTFPAMLGNATALGVVLAVAAYSGATMFGAPDVHPDEGRWPTKEDLRKRFRRPVNETINELGEGRGFFGEGYDERRKQRIKDNHGVEVQDPFWKTQAPAQPYQ